MTVDIMKYRKKLNGTVILQLTLPLVILIVSILLMVAVLYSMVKYKEFIAKPYIEKINESNKRMDDMIASSIVSDERFKQALLDSVSYMNPRIDPSINEQIVDVTIKESRKYKFPPLLILCIINEESGFNPLARNSMGTVGLMQVIPEYHKKKVDRYKWKVHEVYFIRNNIVLGTEILEEYFNDTGNMSSALQKYVGATVKENAKQYIENITNNYITLNVMLFMDKKRASPEAINEKTLSNNSFYGSSSR